MDWLKEFGGVVAAVLGVGMTAILGWVKGISMRVSQHETRVAVLEATAQQVPTLLKDIRDEISGMRHESRESQQELYKHIDGFRREVKADLLGKVDKR